MARTRLLQILGRAALTGLLIGFMSLVAVPGTHAQTADSLSSDEPRTAPPEGPPVIAMTLTPADQTFPALDIQLYKSRLFRKPGNAATFYYRALLLNSRLHIDVLRTYDERSDAWLDGMPDESEQEEMREWLAHHDHILGELQEAVARAECDWDLQIENLQGMSPVMFLLHDFQDMRSLARMLQVRTRLATAEGDLDGALESVAMGLKMARDTAEPPNLVCSLIGCAIAGIMTTELEYIIDVDDSPNLYWAVMALPRPIVDMRESLAFELSLPDRLFPGLEDAESQQRTPEEWRRVVERAAQGLMSMAADFEGLDEPPGWRASGLAAALSLRGYTQAKRALVEMGIDPDEVEAMPVGQVVAIYQSRVQRGIFHDLFKWTLLPYPQALIGLRDANRQLTSHDTLRGTAAEREIIPLAQLLMPATQAAFRAQVRVDRHMAAVASVESLRMHVANHGALPESLDQLEPVPAPVDPGTGQPFHYERLDDRHAVLEMPPLEGIPAIASGRRYELAFETR